MNKGREVVKNPENFADVLYGSSLTLFFNSPPSHAAHDQVPNTKMKYSALRVPDHVLFENRHHIDNNDNYDNNLQCQHLSADGSAAGKSD